MQRDDGARRPARHAALRWRARETDPSPFTRLPLDAFCEAPPTAPSALERLVDKSADAIADLMPVVVLGGFALAATRSSVRVGLGKLLEQSDTLVVATSAALGWGVTQYVKHVDRRFDAADRIEKERFDRVMKVLDELVKDVKPRKWF